MKIHRLVLFMAMTPFFMGCASQIAINTEDFSIKGKISDFENEEPVSEVKVKVIGLGKWGCDEIIADEDGEYSINNSNCLSLNKKLSNSNPKEDQLEFSIEFEREGYHPENLSLTWNLNDKIYPVPEIELRKFGGPEQCPQNHEPCSKSKISSGCCKVCASSTYWDIEDGEEICKPKQKKGEIKDTTLSKYLGIKVIASQVKNLSFGIDGFPADESIDNFLIDWDKEESLGIMKTGGLRILKIICIVEEADYSQIIEWQSDATAEMEDKLQIKWDNGKKMFITNWETK